MGVSERTSHDKRHISVIPDRALVRVLVLVHKVLVPVLVHMAQVPVPVLALALVHPGTPAVAITTQQTRTSSHHV